MTIFTKFDPSHCDACGGLDRSSDVDFGPVDAGAR
jgi:hypothetical protein